MRSLILSSAFVALFVAVPSVRAADDPLAYVPSNAAVFAHARVGDVWGGPLIKSIRALAGKEVDKLIGQAQEYAGIHPDIVETATFLYPTMPQGPGDERTFVVVVTTNKPYDRDALLKPIRKKDAKVVDNRLELQEKFVLYFASDTMFLVMHDSLVDKFAKAPVADNKEGVMTEALKMARDKHHFVLSQDFSKLPNELFTAAPPELQAFLPLLKARTNVFVVDLKTNLRGEVRLQLENENAAKDAERSFNLLMKLATDGLADVLKDPKTEKDVGPLMPALKELERAVKNVKITQAKERLTAEFNYELGFPIAQIVVEAIKMSREGAARGEASNNLRQIALAMHAYNDTHRGLPPAAICDKKGRPLLSWRVAILPFIEQENLYKQFKLDEEWDSEHNKKLIAKMPKTYQMPGTKADGKTHYRVFHSGGAVFDPIQQIQLQEIPDGTAYTIMVVETADASEWTKPDDIEFDDKTPIEKLLRFVNDKTSVAFCDGSVRFLKKGLPDRTWRILIQRNDGEMPPADFDK